METTNKQTLPLLIIPSRTPSTTTSPSSSPQPSAEYGLQQNFFDPSKSSPPNEFMTKLFLRYEKFRTV